MNQARPTLPAKRRHWEYKDEEVIALRAERLKEALLLGMSVAEIVTTILIIGLKLHSRRRDGGIAHILLDEIGEDPAHERHKGVIAEIRSRIEVAVGQHGLHARTENDLLRILDANEALESFLPEIEKMILPKSADSELLMAIVTLINEKCKPHPELNIVSLNVEFGEIADGRLNLKIKYMNGGAEKIDIVSISMSDRGDGFWVAEVFLRGKKKGLRIPKQAIY